MSKLQVADNTVLLSVVNTPPMFAAAGNSGGGVGGVGVGDVVVAPPSVAPAAVVAAAPDQAGGVVGATVTYAAGVRTRILQHTNLIPDLVGIIVSYAAFCGIENITVNGHTAGVLCVAVFPNGNFCSGSSDGTIKIWNEDGACLQTLQGT